MRVLFVDDNVLLLVNDSLSAEDLGHEAVTINSGNEACELLTRDRNFDAIVTDMQMPDGNGLVVLEFLKEHELSIPTLLHSANDFYVVDGTLVELRDLVKNYPFADFAPKAGVRHIEQFLASISVRQFAAQ